MFQIFITYLDKATKQGIVKTPVISVFLGVCHLSGKCSTNRYIIKTKTN